MNKRRVAVVSLGGTISSIRESDGATGVTPSLDADELVSQIPQIGSFAEIETMAFKRVASPAISFSDLFDLTEKIDSLFHNGIDGVVVTQGTDTIEETSFFLNCTVKSNKPVIVTGAMRNPTLAGADGSANLLEAIEVAATKETQGLGTLVVMNDFIYHSRYVTKEHTSNPAAFTAFPTGTIGWISEDKVRIAMKPVKKRFVIEVNRSDKDKNVGFLTIVIGDDGGFLRDIIKLDYDGLILEGAGGGHVIPSFMQVISSIAKEIPIVLTSRTRHGEILNNTYSFRGSESDLIKNGVISGGSLNSLKARILLYLLLRKSVSRDYIRKTFERI